MLRKLGHVEVRVEPAHIPECLVHDDHSGEKRSTGRLMVELTENVIDQTRTAGEESSIATQHGAFTRSRSGKGAPPKEAQPDHRQGFSLSLGTVEGAKSAIGRLSDGGIDGLIKEDVLGLDAIYVQAKRWQDTIPIDGEQLAQFMIKYDPGVSVEESIEIKEIDIDYFET